MLNANNPVVFQRPVPEGAYSLVEDLGLCPDLKANLDASPAYIVKNHRYRGVVDEVDGQFAQTVVHGNAEPCSFQVRRLEL